MTFNPSILGALVPIFIVILSGYVFRKVRFPGDDFWSYAERVTYFILFPSLLFQKTATAQLESQQFILMAAALFVAVLAMTVLLLLVLPWWSAGKASFTSYFQGSIRFNTYVGLAAAFALFGNEGLAMSALALAVLIPLLNILCVCALVVFDESGRGSWRTVIYQIVRNPLVIACITGTLLNMTGISLHAVVDETLMIFGRAALPLGLLSVGAGLNFTDARKSGKIVMAACFLKLLAFPLLMWSICTALGLDPAGTSIAVLFAALPGSPAAYILSKQLGGDSLLMASIITAQTPLSMVSLPIIMAMIMV
jgi:predicted permease